MKNSRMLFIFSVGAVVVFLAMVTGAAWKQGWLMPRDSYQIRFNSASGLYSGTNIILNGLKIGEVTSVELDNNGLAIVECKLLRKYASQLKVDATATSQRTFVIGEKVIAITPGSKTADPLPKGGVLKGTEAVELTDILSGNYMSKYFQTFELLMEQLKQLVGSTGEEGQDLAGLYKQAHKTLKGLERLSDDVHSIKKDVVVTADTKMLLKNAAKSSSELQTMMSELNKTLPLLNQAAHSFNGMTPELAKALKESVLTLQAMQKSFLLRGGVKEVKQEQEKERQPASNP